VLILSCCNISVKEKNENIIKFIEKGYFSEIFWESNVLFKDTLIVDTIYFDTQMGKNNHEFEFKCFYYQSVSFDNRGLISHYQLSIPQSESNVKYSFEYKDHEIIAHKMGYKVESNRLVNDTLKSLIISTH
jgi:hypothetical protein